VPITSEVFCAGVGPPGGGGGGGTTKGPAIEKFDLASLLHSVERNVKIVRLRRILMSEFCNLFNVST